MLGRVVIGELGVDIMFLFGSLVMGCCGVICG